MNQLKKSGQKKDWKTFCELRNKVQREIRKPQTEYFSTKVEEDNDKRKKLWNHIEDIGLRSA